MSHLGKNPFGTEIRLVVPILKLKDFDRKFSQYFIPIDPDNANGLDQVRTLSFLRFAELTSVDF
jgi:hypothetical protein